MRIWLRWGIGQGTRRCIAAQYEVGQVEAKLWEMEKQAEDGDESGEEMKRFEAEEWRLEAGRAELVEGARIAGTICSERE